MIRLKILAMILILLAFTPLIKIRAGQENGGWQDMETTATLTQGLASQSLAILAGKEVQEYVMNKWDGQKFDCNETRKSHELDCTEQAIIILNNTGGLDKIQNTSQKITGKAETYYQENKNQAWFGPTQVKQYQTILKTFSQAVSADAETTLQKSWTGTAYAAFHGGEDPDPEATWNALQFLKNNGKNATITHEFTGNDDYSQNIRKLQGKETDKTSMITSFIKVYSPPTRFTTVKDLGQGMQELAQTSISVILLMFLMFGLAIILWNV